MAVCAITLPRRRAAIWRAILFGFQSDSTVGINACSRPRAADRLAAATVGSILIYVV